MFGTLLDCGTAPYEFKESNSESYFVKLLNRGKETTFWSLGLKEALDSTEIKIGDTVKFTHKGTKQVKLNDGKTAHRSLFEVSIANPIKETRRSNVEDTGILGESDFVRVQKRRSSDKPIMPRIVGYSLLAIWILFAISK